MEKPDSHITESTQSIVADILHLPVDEIEIQEVSGGYSRNRRSLLGHDDNWVFVKEVDTSLLPDEGEKELWWLKKDQLITEALRAVVPELVPAWSRLEADGHVLIMESYRKSDGWYWTPPEDPVVLTEYIQAVVDAVKKLHEVQFDKQAIEALQLQPIFRDQLANDGGFEAVINDESVRQQLTDKFKSFTLNTDNVHIVKFQAMLTLLNNESLLTGLSEAGRSLVNQPNDGFGHCDVRSDNIAYHPETGQLKLVDWNWASYGTQRFGQTEFLVDMARRGVDVTPWLDELNPQLLAAITGFYLKRCLLDPLAPGNTLRDVQAESAAVSYYLYTLVAE